MILVDDQTYGHRPTLRPNGRVHQRLCNLALGPWIQLRPPDPIGWRLLCPLAAAKVTAAMTRNPNWLSERRDGRRKLRPLRIAEVIVSPVFLRAVVCLESG